MTRVLPICLILLTSATAAARPPPEPEPYVEQRPLLEWSTWVRLGYGTSHAGPSDKSARVTDPPSGQARTWEGAFGADATMPIARGGDLRLGVWAEARTSSLPVVGGEVLIGAAPAKIDMFFYRGEGVLAFRGGGNHEVVTGAVSYGYRAPWSLWGPWNGASRYMIGVRFVASATRSIEDPQDWSMTVGLEAEPVGALRYLLGIRSWY